MTHEELVTAFEQLRREFLEHRHTGLDSKQLDSEIESQGSLTAEDDENVDGTYGIEEAGVIANTRTRVGEIEQALKNVGILDM